MLENEYSNKLGKAVYIYILLTSVPFILNKLLNIENLAFFNIIIFFVFSILIMFYRNKINCKIIIYSIILYLTHSLSLIYSISNLDINKYLYENIFYICSSIFIIVIYLFYDKMKNFNILIKNIINPTIIIGWIYCIYNIIENIDKIYNLYMINDAYSVNFSSFFNNRNSFGFLLLICIYANLIYFVNSETINQKRIAIITFILLFVNIVLTLSRTAIASSIIFILLVYLLNNKNNTMKISIKNCSLLIILSIIIILISQTDIVSFIENILVRKETGVTNRDLAWDLGFSIIKENFFTGVGITNAERLVSQSVGNGNYHNTYIQIFVVGGIFNLLVYTFIVLDSAIKSVQVYKYDKKIGSILLSIIISMLVYFCFETINILSFGLQGSLVTIYMIILPQLYIKNKERIECC